MDYDDNNDGIELDLDSSFGAPFVKLMPAEIVDNRLTAGARLLIGWLRFRVGWNKNTDQPKAYTNVKISTIVDDFGVNRKTVISWMKELETIGILKRSKGGYGQSKHKKLLDPVKVYGPRRIHDVYWFMASGNRTPDSIAFFNNSVDHKSGTTDTDRPLGPKSGTNDTDRPLVPKSGPSLVPLFGPSLVPKSGPSEVETMEVATREEATREEPLRGCSSESTTINIPISSLEKDNEENSNNESITSSYSELKPPRDDDDSGHIAGIRADFARKQEEIAEKMRRQGRAKQDGSHGYEAAQRKLAREEAKAERNKDRPASAKTAEGWWKERHKAYHPAVTFVRWGGKEMKWGVEMLSDYGPKKLQRAFDYLFDNWDRYRQDYAWMKLGLVPGLDFLYRERRNIMAEVETLFKDDDGVQSSDGQDKEDKTFF